MTQVMLDFPEERCGSGAVAASGTGHGFRLRWLAPEASGLNPESSVKRFLRGGLLLDLRFAFGLFAIYGPSIERVTDRAVTPEPFFKHPLQHWNAAVNVVEDSDFRFVRVQPMKSSCVLDQCPLLISRRIDVGKEPQTSSRPRKRLRKTPTFSVDVKGDGKLSGAEGPSSGESCGPESPESSPALRAVSRNRIASLSSARRDNRDSCSAISLRICSRSRCSTFLAIALFIKLRTADLHKPTKRIPYQGVVR